MDAVRTPSAFISYAHEDRPFALAIHDELKRLGVAVWIDKHGLLPGDSLTEKIGDAIVDNDFVIGIVSEASLDSAWCKKELALATTDGINNKKVKVIPVRLDSDVKMPSFLTDTFYVDADRSNPVKLAEELAFAMSRHLELMSPEVRESIAVVEPPPLREASTAGAWSGVRWSVRSGPRPFAPTDGRDATGFAWEIERQGDVRTVIIWMSRDVEASSGGLLAEVADAKRTRGQSVIDRLVVSDNPPAEVLVATYGIRLAAPGYSDDMKLLKGLGDQAVLRSDVWFQAADIEAIGEQAGLGGDQVEDSLDVLDRRGIIKLLKLINAPATTGTVTETGLDRYFQEFRPSYPREQVAVRAKLGEHRVAKTADLTNHTLADELGFPLFVIDHILEVFKSHGYLTLVGPAFGADVPRLIENISPELGRR
jgi:hypothetical protein